MFTLRQLEIFVALAESSRVIDVAESLHMSPSAVSMAVRELEKEVGEELYERIGKRLVLNERGRYFRTHAREIVEGAHHLYQSFKADLSGGHLQLAASVTISNYLLPAWIGDYRSQNATVKITLKTANSTDVIEMVRSGVCDLGFVEGRFEENDLESLILMSDELVVVGSDPVLAQRPFYIDELSPRRWVLRERGSGTREIFLSQISPVDKELNIDMEFEHNEAIKRYLLHDKEALSCLPKLSVSEELRQGKMFEARIKAHRFEREFRLIWRREKIITRVVSDFKRYVSELKIL
ncbi:MAG: LysR family transcriptional regulator [Campylobacterales bacterium]|nr:LysR family transcriptional regulator [Campylobacterales bacterium]